jgi:cytochrome c-type biogenesis protein CcmE
MAPRRKRRRRLIGLLAAVVLLAGALIYTTFSASSEAVTPTALLASAQPGQSYQLTGKVEPGYERRGSALHFRVRERDAKAGSPAVPVTYEGTVPDPFRADREVIVTVRKQDDGFVGERDSLITKCPSKFKNENPNQKAS